MYNEDIIMDKQTRDKWIGNIIYLIGIVSGLIFILLVITGMLLTWMGS